MIPSVDDKTLQLFLGSRGERLRALRAIGAIERSELGLPTESLRARRERREAQTAFMSQLAVPFPRRVARRAVEHVDALDIRLAQRTRTGPLPVDEEVAEENEILYKQQLKLRQNGLHGMMLGAGGGGGGVGGSPFASLNTSVSAGDGAGSGEDATFLTGLSQQQQQQPQPSIPRSFATRRAGHGKRSGGGGGAGGADDLYAGDVLFRPGRAVADLDPSDFWLYARQKVTQRTLGTQVLQHPVVVGQSTDAASLKALLLRSPITDIIRKKIAGLLAATVGRTRCGILFDLLSTRNIIVSGVPHVVGQFIYEHINDVIATEHASLKFVFVGITDNSNCCAARDVFCRDTSLLGRQIAGTKRTFDALDNVHMFAVPPPGGEEPPLGPAVEQSGTAMSRSSPLGTRPWHAAMRKPNPESRPLPSDPLQQMLVHAARVGYKDDDEDNDGGDDGVLLAAANNSSGDRRAGGPSPTIGSASLAPFTQLQRRGVVGARPQSPSSLSSQGQQHSSAASSRHPHVGGLTRDELFAAFDPRDLKYLPNVVARVKGGDSNQSASASRHLDGLLDSVVCGPTVRLSRMSKRYNAATAVMTRRVHRPASRSNNAVGDGDAERHFLLSHAVIYTDIVIVAFSQAPVVHVRHKNRPESPEIQQQHRRITKKSSASIISANVAARRFLDPFAPGRRAPRRWRANNWLLAGHWARRGQRDEQQPRQSADVRCIDAQPFVADRSSSHGPTAAAASACAAAGPVRPTGLQQHQQRERERQRPQQHRRRPDAELPARRHAAPRRRRP